MGARTSYAPGTPCWVDLGSPDTSASAHYYGRLFGWTADFALGEDSGGYGMFVLGGDRVAGVGPLQSPEQPPFWSVYFSVEDLGATVSRVQGAGGQLIAGPMDVGASGRLAVFADPNGSFTSAWEPGTNPGCGRVNDPGCFVWNELASPDMDATAAFYAEAFGLGVQQHGTSAIFTVDGEVVCGAHAGSEGEPDQWSIWFAVEDCAASTDLAAELGGSVIMPPERMSFGIGSMVADPHGAVFGISSIDDPKD